MVKIEQVLRNEHGDNVLNDYFETIIINGNAIIVKKEGLSGLYDAVTYKKILSCEWDDIVPMEDNIIVYKGRGYKMVGGKGTKAGLYNYDGNVVMEAIWDRLVLCANGILATNNGVQGFFRYDGTVLLDCIWKKIEPHAQLILAYMGKGAKRVIYNYDGTIREECGK